MSTQQFNLIRPDEILVSELRRIEKFIHYFVFLICYLAFLYFTLKLQGNQTKVSFYGTISLYSIAFLFATGYVLIAKYDFSKSDFKIAFVLAILLRLIVLTIDPITSTDLNRNLMFGHLIPNGYDPYRTTGAQIERLITRNQLELSVPYTSSWAWRKYDYPSVAIWFFSAIIFLHNPIVGSPIFFAKFIITIFDLLTPFLFIKLLRVLQNEQLGYRIAIIYLFNPLSLFEISLEGQFEGIPTFFTLLAIYYAAKSNKYFSIETEMNKHRGAFYAFLTGIMLAIGFLLKYYPAFFILPLAFYYKSYQQTVKTLSGFFSTAFLLSLPFIFTTGYFATFLEFQSGRQDAKSTYEIVFLGISLTVKVWYLLVLGLLGLKSYLLRNREFFFFTFATTIIFFFIITGNSLFPWYLIMVFPCMALTNLRKYEYLNIIPWTLVVLFYQINWFNDSTHIMATIALTLQFIILGTYSMGFYEETEEKSFYVLSEKGGRLFDLYEWLENRPLVGFILIIVGIGGLIAPFTGFPREIDTWLSIGSQDHNFGQEGVITSFETNALFLSPLWIWLVKFSFEVINIIDHTPLVYTQRFFVKLPIIIAHIAIVAISHVYMKKLDLDYNRRTFILTLIALNPAMIVSNHLWGIPTTLPASLFLLAILFMKLDEEDPRYRKSLLAGISFSFAVMFQFQLIVLVPAFIIALNGKKKFSFSISFTLTFLLFLSSAMIQYIRAVVVPNANGEIFSYNISLWASFNFLEVFGLNIEAFRTPLSQISFVVLILSMPFLYVWLFKKRQYFEQMEIIMLSFIFMMIVYPLASIHDLTLISPLIFIWFAKNVIIQPNFRLIAIDIIWDFIFFGIIFSRKLLLLIKDLESKFLSFVFISDSIKVGFERGLIRDILFNVFEIFSFSFFNKFLKEFA
ncbi:MAG: hypothetical protein IH840_05330 [Candidatus Heimdallarchaeota archaeon]|nr:hypothetical protein [Candidatus Heimdallarchaeota archaeon]